jgi:hypothetical protein
VAYFFIFKKYAQGKQSPNGRKFAQSGHPDRQLQMLCKGLRQSAEHDATKVANPFAVHSLLDLLHRFRQLLMADRVTRCFCKVID